MERAHIHWFQVIPPDGSTGNSQSFLVPRILTPDEKHVCFATTRMDPENGWPVQCKNKAVAHTSGTEGYFCKQHIEAWKDDVRVMRLRAMARNIPLEVLEALGEGWMEQQLGCEGRPTWQVIYEGPLTLPEPCAKVLPLDDLFG